MKKVALLFLLLISSSVFAQEQKKPLKVGLVLSGGGAKGLAHIGVLKVLEDEGLEISYIGGTSMGAIIGGLYASGYSASELDSIFRNTDFENIVQDNLPRAVKSFYEKDNDEKYAFTLPFNKFKIGIPLALSKGQNTYNLLNRLTYRVHDISDFSKLPIPFLCVATDIETGQAVILKKGYLPQAMKASGAFPSLFNPVEIDGRYLIDGGVVNNYPIDEVRAMGADIIIGVDVQEDLLNRESMGSAMKVVMQIVNFQMYQGMKAKAAATDIYIKPAITGFNVVSFDQGAQIVKNGEDAAAKFKKQIRELVAQQQAPPKPKERFVLPESICIHDVEIIGNKRYSRAYVLGKMRLTSNENLTFDKLDAGLSSLNATQNFKQIDYRLEDSENGDKLILDLKETRTSTYLKFGLHYDGLFKSAALINYTKKNLLTKNDVTSLDLILGDNIRYNFDYYIDNGFYLSLGVRSSLTRFKADVPASILDGTVETDVNKIAIKYTDFTNQLYLQTLFRQVFSVGVGLEHKNLNIQTETFDIGNKSFEDNNYISTYGYVKFDTYDNKYFPKSGFYFDGNFKWLLYSSTFNGDQFGRFSIAQGNFGYATSIFKRLTFRFQSEGGFLIGEGSGNMDFVLGGYGFNPFNNIKPFYGYDFVSLIGNSYIKSTLGADFEFIRKNHVNFYANYANIGNDIFDGLDWFSIPTYSGYAVGYGLETLLGPLEVKYSWSPDNSQHFWWFSMGFWF